MEESTQAVMFASGSSDWQTPEWLADLVDDIFEGITLDPASPGEGKTTVMAEVYYTKAMDGLSLHWPGTVYLNPPYGKEIGVWTRKLRTEFDAKICTGFITLVPARVDAKWWRELITPDMRVVFLHQRVKFLNPEWAEEDPAPFPSALIYGEHDTLPDRFEDMVREFGSVYALL